LLYKDDTFFLKYAAPNYQKSKNIFMQSVDITMQPFAPFSTFFIHNFTQSFVSFTVSGSLKKT